jgi:hypothetical protein
MTISLDAKKVFNKMHHSFMVKALKKQGIEEMVSQHSKGYT